MINFRYADLSGATFANVNLSGADLTNADLSSADLTNVDLSSADLTNADLSSADLTNVDLSGADLTNADLSGATFANVNLSSADLINVDLQHTTLKRTNLDNTNLKNTILDPLNKIPSLTDEEILKDGLEIDGGFVLGWRTQESQVIIGHIYEPGVVYTAPIFSTCQETSCHPGIYLSSRNFFTRSYSNYKLVRVACRRDELIHAGSKWRARRIMVLPDA
jgi:hypothetical protein